jgi:hypothetical protein
VGNPGADEQGAEESEPKELDFWDLREMYIQALAAGISDEQYSRMTLTKVIAHIEAERHRRYWHARPIITAMMPHLGEKAVKAIAMGKGKGDSYASKALQKMLEEYAPVSQRSPRKKAGDAGIIPDLPPEAAMGVVLALQRGDLDGVLWASISRWYPRIAATARRGFAG